jgi:hypothetical protein
MKHCAWCGRENPEERIHCQECGTELPDKPIQPRPSQPRDWSSARAAAAYIAATLVFVFFYFLSFGPVTRVFMTVSKTPTTTTVSYPIWVAIIYYPALSLMDNASDGTVAGLYWRYLEWWQPPPTNN